MWYVLWSNDGLSPPQIAQRVRLSRRTVTRYIKRYEAEGLLGLFTRSRPGRPRRATTEYEAQLLQVIAQEPRSLGLSFSNWTTAKLADYMAQQTGITLSPRQVENYLKVNDWRLRRPVRTVKHKQDTALFEENKHIAELKTQAGPDLILFFGDSAEVSTFPTITRCWTPIGKQRVILTPGTRAAKRWNWGAVDPITGRTASVIHRRRNNVGFRRLLAAISRAYDLPAHPERRVILFVDNDKAHKAKHVQHLLKRHDHQIQVEWLPPYSPELNPQEDIWQDMRRCVTHNHYFEHIDVLLEAVREFHQQLGNDPARVLRLLRKWTKLIST